MHEQRIAQIKQSIRAIMDQVLAMGEEPPPEIQELLRQYIERAQFEINELRRQQEEEGRVGAEEQAPVPESAELLWILSGGNPEVFTQYLNTFPDQSLQALLRNPTQLAQVLEQLSRQMPQGERGSADGIQQAPIESSNIYGFRYDPNSGKMKVRFQSGSVYEYNGVPPAIFRIFQHGAIPARTTGRNQFGQWWTGKFPSLGAAFYQLIRQGNYPYQRLQ